MLGRDHAWSGVAAGIYIATALSHDTFLGALPFAVIMAGYALAPDLDCEGSTPSRFLGPISEALSQACRFASSVAFRCTATSHDQKSHGTHRHLTHTAAFAFAMGGLAAWTCHLSPWAVAGWIAFGVLAGSAALSDWVLPVFIAAVVVPMLLDHTPLMVVLAGMQHWMWIAVTGGFLTHIAGDAITVSGVPLLWPIPIRHQTWHPVHFLPHGFRLHTGLRVEKWIVHPLLICSVAAAAITI